MDYPESNQTGSLRAPTAELQEIWAAGQRYARRLVGCPSDSEEIVQEAFCRLYKSRTQAWESTCADPSCGASRQEFGALFFKTIRNLCVDQLRRRSIRSTETLEFVQPAVAEATHPTILKETASRLRAAIAGLPENWRDALLLRVDGGLGYDQIADVLDCTKARVRMWIYRARRQLADHLAVELDPEIGLTNGFRRRPPLTTGNAANSDIRKIDRGVEP